MTKTEKMAKENFDKKNEKKKSKTLMASIKELLGVAEKFSTGELADGTEIMYEGELAPGVVVSVSADGQEIPLPEGKHELGGDMAGQSIVVDAAGTILEIINNEAPSEVEVEVEEVEEEEMKNSNEEVMSLLKGFINKNDQEIGLMKKELEANKKAMIAMTKAIESMGIEKKKFSKQAPAFDPTEKLA